MLQTDAAAVVEKGLEVLVVVVDLVLHRQQRLHQMGVGGAGLLLHLREVLEVTEAIGYRALGQRPAFQGGDDADHVLDLAVLVGGGLDAHDLELLGGQAEGRGGEAALAGQADVVLVDRHAVDAVASDDQKAHRMDRGHGARRQDGALHALLPAARGEGLDVIEGAEL